MRLAWCDYEVAFLKEEYPERGVQYVADKLNRTYLSVKSQAKKLNVQRSNLKYSDEEVEIIRKYYPEWGVKKCAELMPGRSETSIAKKAQDLDIKCNLIKQRQNIGLRTHDMPKGFYMGSEGYYIYTPTGKTVDRILYHRYVMQQHLGRKLRSDEIVHHKDENKLNNDISNLEIMTRAEHASHHHGQHLKDEEWFK